MLRVFAIFRSHQCFSPYFFLPVLEVQILRKYNISVNDFVLLEELIQLEQPYKAGKPWKFAGSFYYATTVLTTIGKQANIPTELFEILGTSKSAKNYELPYFRNINRQNVRHRNCGKFGRDWSSQIEHCIYWRTCSSFFNRQLLPPTERFKNPPMDVPDSRKVCRSSDWLWDS